MPRKHRNRTMKGGFLDNLSNSLSGLGNTISSSATNLWGKTKSAVSGLTNSSVSTTSTPTISTPTTNSTTYGGKKRRSRRNSRTRKISGGFKDYTPLTGIASHASLFSGNTAKPHTWVGGRSRKNKSKKHRSHRRTRHISRH